LYSAPPFVVFLLFLFFIFLSSIRFWQGCFLFCLYAIEMASIVPPLSMTRESSVHVLRPFPFVFVMVANALDNMTGEPRMLPRSSRRGLTGGGA